MEQILAPEEINKSKRQDYERGSQGSEWKINHLSKLV